MTSASNLKNFCFTLLSSLLIFLCNAQENPDIMGVSRTVTERSVLDLDKIYYKGSGKKVPERKMVQIIKNNPSTYLERVYDIDGSIKQYLYDPNDQQKKLRNDRHREVKPGSPFPNFRVTTIDGKRIELKDLLGKLVILRFDMNSFTYTNKLIREINQLDSQIRELDHPDSVEAIVIFEDYGENVQNSSPLKDSQFNIIDDGGNFMRMFGITRIPSTLIIGRDGTLIKSFSYSEDIDLQNYL